MGKIKEMLEDLNTKKTAKRYGRTFEQQKYRKELAKSLKGMRSNGEEGKKLASETLEYERSTTKYLVSSLSKNKKGGNDLAKEVDIHDLVCNIENFEGLDQSVADRLVNGGYREIVMNNVDKFSGLNFEKIFMDINKYVYDDIERKNFYLNIIDKFDGFLDITKMIRVFYRSNPPYEEILIETIGIFEKRQDYKEIIKALISTIHWSGGLQQSRLFSFLSHVSADADILKYLYGSLDEGGRGIVAKYIAGHISKFHGLLDMDIAKILLSGYEIKAIGCNNIPYMKRVTASKQLIKGIKRFEGSDHKGIAEMIIEKGDNVELLIKNLNSFNGVNYDKEIANLLVKYGQIECLAKYLHKFSGLDSEIAEILIKKGYGTVVSEHLEVFGLEKDK